MNIELELVIEDPDYEINCEVEETIAMDPKIITPITITRNGVYRGGVSNGCLVGYSPVTVNVPGPKVVPITITKNGTYTAEENNGFSPVKVEIPTYEGDSSVTPSVNAQILKTAQRYVDHDIKIEKIPYSETTNNSKGKTVTIG